MRSPMLSLLCVAMLMSAAPAGASVDARISAAGPTEVTSLCNADRDVALARSGSAVVAAWTGPGTCERNTVPTPADSSASVAWSADGGATWTEGAPLPLGDLGTIYGRADVAASPDGTFVYVVTGQEPTAEDPSGRQIVAAYRSVDGGRTWSDPEDLSRLTTLGIDTGVSSPTVTVDATLTSPHAGNVYAAWNQYIDASFDDQTFIARSLDGGKTFGTPQLLTLEAGGLQLATGPGGEVYAAWVNGQAAYVSVSLDGGASFGSPVLVTYLSRLGHLYKCGPLIGYRYVLDGNIAVDQHASIGVDTYPGTTEEPNPRLGRVYLAVAVDGPGVDEADVVLITSDDRGATWSAPKTVGGDATGADQFLPRVAVDGRGVVAMAWHDRRLAGPSGTGMDVFGAVSTDGGATFGAAQRLSDATTVPGRGLGWRHLVDPCYFPQQRNALVARESGFLAGWADNRAGAELPDFDVYAEAFG